MNRPWVDIVIGSKKSDAEFVEGATMVLKACGVEYKVSAISAHRHPEKLRVHCRTAIVKGVSAFIAAAGMNAALPGAIASVIEFSKFVFGVALKSPEFPIALDAMLAITRMPGGCPVAFAGIGKAGFKNAALLACLTITSGTDEESKAVKQRLFDYIKEQAGEPDENYETSEGLKEEN